MLAMAGNRKQKEKRTFLRKVLFHFTGKELDKIEKKLYNKYVSFYRVLFCPFLGAVREAL